MEVETEFKDQWMTTNSVELLLSACAIEMRQLIYTIRCRLKIQLKDSTIFSLCI